MGSSVFFLFCLVTFRGLEKEGLVYEDFGRGELYLVEIWRVLVGW